MVSMVFVVLIVFIVLMVFRAERFALGAPRSALRALCSAQTVHGMLL